MKIPRPSTPVDWEKYLDKVDDLAAKCIDMENTLRAITEEGVVDCEGCRSHEQMALRCLGRVPDPTQTLARSLTTESVSVPCAECKELFEFVQKQNHGIVDIGYQDYRKAQKRIAELEQVIKERDEALRWFDKERDELKAVLQKIAEAERMGYGTQRSYGEIAKAALEGK